MDSFRSKLRRLTECSICFEFVSQPKLLPCFHTFCSSCISRHLNKSLELGKTPTCPLCRRGIPKTDGLQTNILLRQLTELGRKKVDSLAADDILTMKSQVLESRMLMGKCLQKIRNDVDEIKHKLQNKLDSDYRSILKELDEFEISHKNTSSFYSSMIDDLLSDFPDTMLSCKNGQNQNHFFNPMLSFFPRTYFSNLNGENVIGDLRYSIHDDLAVKETKPTGSLYLLGVLKNEEDAQGRTNVGVAMTKSYICSVNVLSQVIQLFDIPSLKLVRSIVVPNLRNPQDLCSLPRSDRLYVADSYDNVLHMIEIGSQSFHCWPMSLEPTNISSCIQTGPRVWVACRHSDELLEIDGDTGKQLRKIDLQPQIIGVNHVLSLECSEIGGRVLVLCHGVLMSDCRHQVLIIDDQKGKPMLDWCLGSGPSSGMANVNHPSYLAVVLDSNNKPASILVADQGNNRILHLDFPSLKFLASFNDYNGKCFKNPQKIIYDSYNKILLVVENEMEGGILALYGL